MQRGRVSRMVGSMFRLRSLWHRARRLSSVRRRESKGRVFSGIQPTGSLHLGNYLGRLRTKILRPAVDDYWQARCVPGSKCKTMRYGLVCDGEASSSIPLISARQALPEQTLYSALWTCTP